MNSKSRIISTDEDPSLRIESSAIINLRGVSTKLNKYKNTYNYKKSHNFLASEYQQSLGLYNTVHYLCTNLRQ